MTTILDKFFGTYIGIEFQDDSITIVLLRNSLSGFGLLSTSRFALSDDERALNDIREYINQHAITPGNVFVCVPDKWAITKFIEVPQAKGKAALPKLMRFEIERHIPFQIEDIAFDFQVMSQKDTMCSVVFVALQKSRMDFVRGLLDKLSLQPRIITIASFASINSMELRGSIAGGWKDIVGIAGSPELLGKKDEATILLFTREADATFAISRGGAYTYLKSFAVASGYDFDVFYDKFHRHLDEARALLSISDFSRIYLGGDISLIQGIEESFGQKTDIPVAGVRKLSVNVLETESFEDRGIDAALGACYTGIGSGTYHINLLPHKVDYESRRIGALTAKILAALIIIIIVAIISVSAVKEKKHINAMEAILEKNKPEIMAVEKLTEEIEHLERQNLLLRKVKNSGISLELLVDLTGKLPDDAWITNLNYKGVTVKDNEKEGGELIISGFASSSSSLIPILEDSQYLEKVEFVGPIKKAKEKEQFKIRASIVLSGS